MLKCRMDLRGIRLRPWEEDCRCEECLRGECCREGCREPGCLCCCDGCEAICEVLESIALTEAALAHILNAEGEKLEALTGLESKQCSDEQF